MNLHGSQLMQHVDGWMDDKITKEHTYLSKSFYLSSLSTINTFRVFNQIIIKKPWSEYRYAESYYHLLSNASKVHLEFCSDLDHGANARLNIGSPKKRIIFSVGNVYDPHIVCYSPTVLCWYKYGTSLVILAAAEEKLSRRRRESFKLSSPLYTMYFAVKHELVWQVSWQFFAVAGNTSFS